MTYTWIKLNINGQQMIGEVQRRVSNELYETGKSATYNEQKGGYTYIIACVSSDRTTAYGDLTIEVKSNMFSVLGIEYISDDERKSFMSKRNSSSSTNDANDVELPDFFGLGSDEEGI